MPGHSAMGPFDNPPPPCGGPVYQFHILKILDDVWPAHLRRIATAGLHTTEVTNDEKRRR